jgi:SAM-dependent methyltransferase
MFESARTALKYLARKTNPVDYVVVTRQGKEIRCGFDEYDNFRFRTGDVLSVVQGSGETPLITPDDNMHVMTSKSLPIRVPPKYELGEFHGFHLPLHLVMLTGAGIETMDPFGKAHVNNYEKYMWIPENASLLEIGCGIGRDAFQLIQRSSKIKRYVGVDVTRDSIVWCQKNITKCYPNFTFVHFNAKHELYNPLGFFTSLDFQLPAPDRSIDRVFLGSVFTHLFETEITHYMKEICRVLRPGGVAYATFFLYTQEIVEAARRTLRTPFGLTFEHAYGDGCFISNPSYPTGAVAFTSDATDRMMKNAHVKLVQPLLPGGWSGYFEEWADGQEVALLTPD